MKKLIFITLVVSAVTVAGFVASNRACVFMKSCVLAPKTGSYGGLHLRQDQRTAIKELEKSFRPGAQALCGEICDARKKLIEYMESGPGSDDRRLTEVARIGELQTRLEQSIVRHMAAVSKVLDSEQRARYFANAKSGIGCPAFATAAFRD